MGDESPCAPDPGKDPRRDPERDPGRRLHEWMVAGHDRIRVGISGVKTKRGKRPEEDALRGAENRLERLRNPAVQTRVSTPRPPALRLRPIPGRDRLPVRLGRSWPEKEPGRERPSGAARRGSRCGDLPASTVAVGTARGFYRQEEKESRPGAVGVPGIDTGHQTTPAPARRVARVTGTPEDAPSRPIFPLTGKDSNLQPSG